MLRVQSTWDLKNGIRVTRKNKGENKKMDKAKALIASWARSFMAAALALYMAGVTDPKTLAMAGVAAIAPVPLSDAEIEPPSASAFFASASSHSS